MPSVIIVIVLTLIIFLVIFLFTLHRLKHYKRLYAAIYEKYADVIDTENECIKIREDAERYKQEQISKAEGEVSERKSELDELNEKIEILKKDYSVKYSLFEKLVHEAEVYEDISELYEYGLYEPHFEFGTSEEYQDKIKNVRDEEKSLIKDKSAARCTTQWYIDGSKAEGTKETNRLLKLMLRAFNGECDAMIADVRWNNYERLRERLDKSFEKINTLGAPHKAYIADRYRNLKQEELRLTYEYQEKLYREKEEQRAIREQMKEEEKVQQDIEKKQKEIERHQQEEALLQEKVKKAFEEGKKSEAEKYENEIMELKRIIADGQRAVSMAQQTKAGHVYIISNIGSFGENMYKIGMTRRLDPMERVYELCSASVPFRFDVHAMIFSENAPELESAFHKHFDRQRVNLVNTKKEFFYVTLSEIEEFAVKNGFQIKFTKAAEARDWRESESIRNNHKKKQNVLDTIPAEL